MSKESFLRCDVCGKKIIEGPRYWLSEPRKPKLIRYATVFYGQWMGEESFDICNSCWEKFKIFVMREEND